MLKTIALVGRPNVGKSSLFNILSKRRDALVADFPGLTRDRHYSKIRINDSNFLIVDTGGLEISTKSGISNKMFEQAVLAIDESDIIFFIVDGRFGRHPQEDEISNFLRKKNKIILLIINKCEGLNHSHVVADFTPLGIKNYVCISASHNEGISLLYDFLLPLNEKTIFSDNKEEKLIKLAILGKPNVGKSTLINTMVGEERFIAFDQPGTTRDSISTDYEYNSNKISIIDTAGIRKKGRVTDKIEKFSLLKSILTINEANITVLIIDAVEGLSSQDLQIFGYIKDAGKPVVLAINKWDLLDPYKKQICKEAILKKIYFFNNIEILYISALKSIGINDLWKSIFRAYKSSIKKIKTSILNKFLIDIQQAHEPPIFKGIRPKLKYIHQGNICPPTFIFHGNHLLGIKKDYLKYLESSIIKTFEYVGTPVSIQLNETDNPYHIDKIKVKKTGLVTRRKLINKRRDQIKKK